MSASPEHSQRVRSPAEGALANTLSLVVLTALSLVTFGYQHVLEPLYGSAPTQLHLNKIVWVACILGSFTATLPLLPMMLASGILLTTMGYTSYWVAVYTGRMGDVILGPLITHLVVLAPVLFLGVASVKALQVSLVLLFVSRMLVGVMEATGTAPLVTLLAKEGCGEYEVTSPLI